MLPIIVLAFSEQPDIQALSFTNKHLVSLELHREEAAKPKPHSALRFFKKTKIRNQPFFMRGISLFSEDTGTDHRNTSYTEAKSYFLQF